MKNTGDYEPSEAVTTGIVIGIIDIVAMIVVIAILCLTDFGF